jgi:hypothetical protein
MRKKNKPKQQSVRDLVLFLWEKHIFRLALIAEGATEQVSQFIMPMKSI